MLTPDRAVSDTRCIVYGLTVLAALTTFKLGYQAIPAGILLGVYLSVQSCSSMRGFS